MKKQFLDKLSKYGVWAIMLLSILAYLLFSFLRIDPNIKTAVDVLKDPDFWFNLVFTVWLHLLIYRGASDSALTEGLNSDEFMSADSLNNKLIKSVNNEMDGFREYTKKLNYNERLNAQEEFLFQRGYNKYEDLPHDLKKKYDKLKYIQHDISGFNMPLYYESEKQNTIQYKANYVKGKREVWIIGRKLLTGVLFGILTVNQIFTTNLDNVGAAFLQIALMSFGLIMNFVMSYTKPYFKLRYTIPKRVILKATFYSGYIDYKNGTHKLKDIPLVETPEPPIQAVAVANTNEPIKVEELPVKDLPPLETPINDK